ncbi:MAG: NADH-quinone oxidoreductase subunit C [Bacteroidota bacterium]
MNNEELKSAILAIQPAATFDESGEFLNVHISSELLLPLMLELRNNKDFYFDYLFCETCIDWKDHLMMVYHLTSKSLKHTLVVKGKISNRDNAEIESVAGIWKTAEFMEREVYELFGVKFLNHPDLRKLILDDYWTGYPLRKDYSDPVNLIEY